MGELNKVKALIISNGTINDIDILRKVKKEYKFILAADGGTNHCIRASILPDLVIGDLDSISNETLKVIEDNNILIEKFPTKKDVTDTELCIDYLINRGFKDITLIGVTGNRMDHTMANILLLNKLKNKGIKGKIIDENNTIYLVDTQLTLTKEVDFFVSIIPITNSGIIISLRGFEYGLEHVRVNFASTVCISNKIIEENGTIEIHKGKALVFISKD